MPQRESTRALRMGKRAWAAVRILATIFGVLGGLALIHSWTTSSEPGSVKATLATPPNIPIEVKARAADAPFNDDVAAAPGEQVQIFTMIKNIGRMGAEEAVLKIHLPRYAHFEHGTCRVRRSDSPDLVPCSDNIVGGGFSFPQTGAGSWLQLYFYARLGSGAPPRRVLLIRGTVNSSETPELKDVVRIYPQVA